MKMRPWTYSQLESFESCPRKFYRTKVLRDIVEPPTVHTKWGHTVHSAFEDAINTGVDLPEGMAHWQPLATKIVKLKGEKHTEQRYAINSAFQPTEWDGAWSRGVADLVVVRGSQAAVLDYKTGKRKLTEQLDLYANYVFHYYPKVDSVTTGFVWLKDRRIDWNRVQREDISLIWQRMLPRVRKLESAYERDSWPAKTSGLCKGWCPVTDCEFIQK